MPTNKKKTFPPLSYADLVAAELFPHGYLLPAIVMQLPADSQEQLLFNPLIPVPIDHPAYAAQRELLESFGRESLNFSLRAYCNRLLTISNAAWKFVAKQGQPDLKNAPAAVRAGDLPSEEGPVITFLYSHWIQLQRYAGTPSKAAAYSGLVSRLSVSH
jgi:hypothetical protein